MAALREIVINMIVHRDYRSANDSTIKFFDDRIEFFNPGALLDDLTVEKIKTGNYKSHLRNKQIASIFEELELIEKYGSRVRRVIETCVDYGLPEPVFEATQGGMAVTVFKQSEKETLEKTRDGVSEGVSEGVIEGVIEGVSEGVSEGANALIRLISEQPGLRAPAIANLLGTSPKNIERWLKQLKDQAKIEFKGAPKTGGYYSK